MKLRLLVLAAFCPILASAQSIFDFINPFYWIFNLILDAIVPENAICGIVEVALEGAVGQGDVIQCSCNNVFNVFLLFPLGITSGAACSTTASLDLNNIPGESNKKLKGFIFVTMAGFHRLHANI